MLEGIFFANQLCRQKKNENQNQIYGPQTLSLAVLLVEVCIEIAGTFLRRCNEALIEEISQCRRAVGNPVSGARFKPQTSRSRDIRVPLVYVKSFASSHDITNL